MGHKKLLLVLITIALVITVIWVLKINIRKGSGSSLYSQTSISYNRKGITVKELKKDLRRPGYIYVTGFVVKKSPCPTCPENVACSPCIGNHLMISDKNNVLGITFENQIGVIVRDKESLDSFDIGRKYTFTVQISDTIFIGGSNALLLPM